MSRALIIPAAGRGVRLGTSVPKVLVHVAGRPMLRHLLDLYRPYVAQVIVVAAPAGLPPIEAAIREWGCVATLACQHEPTGMLDAILIGLSALAPGSFDRAWITWGDQVAVLPATLDRLAAVEAGTDVALPTVPRESPYVHFARDGSGRIVGVRQRREGDAMPASGESDMGVFSLSARAASTWLQQYAATAPVGTATAERNFLPFIPWAAVRGAVATCVSTDPIEAIGINTPAELEAVERVLLGR